MSGHISTPGRGAGGGVHEVAVGGAVGVVTLTSDSVTATALTTRGSIRAIPAPTSTPNCRLVTNPRAS